MKKYACVCCDNLTLEECPPGTHLICPICKWEDDKYQFNHPEYEGGANVLSLNQARQQFHCNQAHLSKNI